MAAAQNVMKAILRLALTVAVKNALHAIRATIQSAPTAIVKIRTRNSGMIKQQKLQCLFSLALSLIGFGVAITIIILDVNVAVRLAGLFAAFLSGWGCCCSLGVMSGGITNEN